MNIECPCLSPPIHHSNYSKTVIGIDETNGRFGEVRLEVCTMCHRTWLRYFVEYECFSKSGRWYRGVISEETAKRVTPENAVEILEGLNWHIFGGSYFETTGQKGSGPIRVDL